MTESGSSRELAAQSGQARTLRDYLGAAVAGLRRLFVPVPMVKVGLFFLAEEASAVVSVLARLGACHLVRVPAQLKEYLTPCFPEPFRQAFRHLREHHEPLAQRWQTVGETDLETVEPRVPSVADLDRLSGLLEPLHRQVRDLDQRGKQLQERQFELDHFDVHVRALAELDINVQELTDLRFLHLQAGTVPQENVDRLRESAALSDDLVLTLGKRHDRAHVLVLGAGGMTPELEGLLAKAHFEPLDVSRFHLAQGMGDIDAQLASELAEIQGRLTQLEKEEEQLRESNRGLLREAADVVARATVFAECDGAIEGRASVAFLSGWVSRERLQELEQALAQGVRGPVALLHEPAPAEGESEPFPTDITVPAVLQPAASLVALYGRPGHDELNPMLVVAAATPFLFGMMFGDVGYGLLLCVAAIVCRRRLGHWVAPVLSCSLASMFFGFLYGSVFGVEHWLPALWLRPMEQPFRLLGFALGVGVVLLLLTFVLKAATLLRQGRREEALCGFHAGAGALIYIGAVILGRAVSLGQTLPLLALCLVFTGSVLIVVHAVREVRAHGQSALADLGIELFHGSLTLLTNTLSFLRLAAFALAHAALSLALFLIIKTIPPTPAGWVARVLVLVFGMTVILVLDTLAVAVQTIRLQFYEGLARYYRGDGQEYCPLRFPAPAPVTRETP